jgi:citrate lyase subunit beta/citryl-CoA lyase
MPENMSKALRVVRRSKLYVPINRDKFVNTAWKRGADCIILDLEDSIPPEEKESARKMVKDIIPVVKKGGADVEVRINRGYEKEDLNASIFPGLSSIMIPKCESDEEIRGIDRMVSELEIERALPEGNIQFALLIETAIGVINAESIAKASNRIVQVSLGQGDLAIDIGFPRFAELNFEQYFYPANKVLYAAAAAKVQATGLGAQKNVNFTNTNTDYDTMFNACRHALWTGYMGVSLIHPSWINAANTGFTPPQSDIEKAHQIKTALNEAYARGEGSVKIDGRMYDVANMKHVNYTLERAELIAKRDKEKVKAIESIQ